MASTNPYAEIAPAVAAKVEAGEITAQQAQESHSLALVIVSFLAAEAKRPEAAAMFASNDGARFIEGMSADPQLMARFVIHAAAVTGRA